MTLYERSGLDIDRGLVGFWKLNDKRVTTTKAIDYAKFNDGTITGAINATGYNGLNPDAMYFDGVDDIIDCGVPTYNITTKLTLCAWAKMDANANFGRIVATEAAWGMLQNANTGELRFYGTGVDNNFPNSGQYMNDGKWHHFAVTYDGLVVRGYVDGASVGTLALTGDLTDAAAISVCIGNRTAADRAFEGNISNVRIYDRTLTDGEISKLHRLKK